MKSYFIENGILYDYKGKTSQPKIPNGVTEIGDCSFCNCINITSIKIPNSVTCICFSAFSGCYNLNSIEIPNSVNTICSMAFYGCYNLNSIEIPNSVTSIGSNAFAHCTRLKSVKIPKSVSFIGYNAFDHIRDVKTQYNENGSLRAFKAFRRDWTCRDFQYKVGKSYHEVGIIRCCKNGFHACTNPLNVFNYYNGNLNELRFAEVEMSGDLDFKFDKVVASKIKIVRELTASELADIYNSMEKF